MTNQDVNVISLSLLGLIAAGAAFIAAAPDAAEWLSFHLAMWAHGIRAGRKAKMEAVQNFAANYAPRLEEK